MPAWYLIGTKTRCSVDARLDRVSLPACLPRSTPYLTPVCVSVFEQTGQLNEYTDRKTMSSDVVCMALGSVPQGEQRSRFLAVGLTDNTVRIISLDPSVSNCCRPELTQPNGHTVVRVLHKVKPATPRTRLGVIVSTNVS